MTYHQIRRLPFRLLLYFTLCLACAPHGMGQRAPQQQERLDEAFIKAVSAETGPEYSNCLIAAQTLTPDQISTGTTP